jgi:hypothetical protein
MDYSRRLLTEAVVVGVGLLPIYALTHNFISVLFPRIKDTMMQDYLSVGISGGLFHLICEEGGINDWYLDNGVAVLKRMEKEKYDWTTSLNDPDLCDGSCGWRNDGMCSHYSMHAQ